MKEIVRERMCESECERHRDKRQRLKMLISCEQLIYLKFLGQFEQPVQMKWMLIGFKAILKTLLPT